MTDKKCQRLVEQIFQKSNAVIDSFIGVLNIVSHFRNLVPTFFCWSKGKMSNYIPYKTMRVIHVHFLS